MNSMNPWLIWLIVAVGIWAIAVVWGVALFVYEARRAPFDPEDVEVE
jgi:hypothetical protein